MEYEGLDESAEDPYWKEWRWQERREVKEPLKAMGEDTPEEELLKWSVKVRRLTEVQRLREKNEETGEEAKSLGGGWGG